MEVAWLRGKLPDEECRVAFNKVLGVLEVLGNKGEKYTQDLIELGLQLVAMRLTAEQALSVVRAFVPLEHH